MNNENGNAYKSMTVAQGDPENAQFLAKEG
jgi:hypothetical protein